MIHELEYVYSRQQQASGRMLQNQHLEHNISSDKTFETQAEYTQLSEAEIAILPKPTRTIFLITAPQRMFKDSQKVCSCVRHRPYACKGLAQA